MRAFFSLVFLILLVAALIIGAGQSKLAEPKDL